MVAVKQGTYTAQFGQGYQVGVGFVPAVDLPLSSNSFRSTYRPTSSEPGFPRYPTYAFTATSTLTSGLPTSTAFVPSLQGNRYWELAWGFDPIDTSVKVRYRVSTVVPPDAAGSITLDTSTSDLTTSTWNFVYPPLHPPGQVWSMPLNTMGSAAGSQFLLSVGVLTDGGIAQNVVGCIKTSTSTAAPAKFYRAFNMESPFADGVNTVSNTENATIPDFTVVPTIYRTLVTSRSGGVVERRLYSWRPSVDGTDFTYVTVTLSDSADNAVWTNVNNASPYGDSSIDGLKIVGSKYGWAVSFDYTDGGRVIKYYQFNLDMSKYRQIIPTGIDTISTRVLADPRSPPTLGFDEEGNFIISAFDTPGNTGSRILGAERISQITQPAQPDWIIPDVEVNPFANRLRAWSMTFDGHTMYVLRVGDLGTYVYDVLTGEWSEFKTDEFSGWRMSVGGNWIGPEIVAGDLETGQIWNVDPEELLDDGEPFTTQITGGYPVRGAQGVPCNITYLTGSTEDAPTGLGYNLTLETSDNDVTYDSQGTVNVPIGYRDQPQWYSLGAMVAPGRVFRLTEYGGMARIEGLSMT